MTPTNRPVGQDDLTAYVDGELPANRLALVEEWLASHPEDKARVQADQRIKQQLGAALAPLADASLPERFRVDRLQRDVGQRRMVEAMKIAAVLALVALGTVSGWYARGPGTTLIVQADEVQAALAAHRIFVPDQARPVEISADGRDLLGAWLGARIGNPIQIPDLSAQGLELVGGRLLAGQDGRPAGQLMYEDADGMRVTLFLQLGYGDDSAFVFAQQGPDATLAWRSPDLAYVLTGPVDREALITLAGMVHKADL